MLRSLFRSLIVNIGLVMIACVPLAAQGARPFSVDITAGLSTGWGGRYFDRSGVAGEVTLIPAHETARIVAVAVGGRGTPASGDICVLESGPGSPCLSRFPALVHVGLLAGLERLSSLGTVRAMWGPAFYGGQGASGIGAQIQFDAAAGFTHVAFVVAGCGSVVARFTGETLRLGSLAVGLRIR